MRVKIYQINSNCCIPHLKFCGLKEAVKLTGRSSVDPTVYDEVFDAELETADLEEIYAQFNTDKHPLYRGHSLSVSDVVVIDKNAYFCDTVGFQKIGFDTDKAYKPDNLMRVVYVEPGKPAYEAEIKYDLDSMQRAVGGGLIEPIYMDDNCILVGNEESKLRGMPGNRYLDSGGIIAGPFFVCGDTREEFRSLTDNEVSKYLDKYAQPEDISDEEVQSDMGFQFFTF